MTAKPRTAEQVRQAGLEVLRRKLGPVDMVRFLQQFDSGFGDYSTERHTWIDDWPLEEILAELEATRTDEENFETTG